MSVENVKKARGVVAWIPNGVTSLSLICGFTAIVLSADLSGEGIGGLNRPELCWLLVGLAAVFDFLDGMVARLLHATSAIGKELDSLCDLVSFGVTPAVLLYHTLRMCRPEWGEWVPWLSVVIAVCGALRLAKFNVDSRQTSSFIGMPIPANAIFWIGFMAYIVGGGSIAAVPTCAVIVCVSLLMVTELPMFSFKLKGSFKLDLLNVSRVLLIISALLFVIILGVAGLMWTIGVYVLLSVVNAIVSRCSAAVK